MKKISFLVICFLLLVVKGRAQEVGAVDSIVVLGQVVNRLSGEPEPYCRVSFLQGTDTMVNVVCDDVGEFGTDPMPVGSYGLSVSLRGMTLHRADLVLNSNAELYISVITDSFQLRSLHEVEVVAPKHLLEESGQLITSADDPRLWDFTYCDWCMWSRPPRVHSASHSADPNAPRVKESLFYVLAVGKDYDKIWQLVYPDRVINIPNKQKSAEEAPEGKKE